MGSELKTRDIENTEAPALEEAAKKFNPVSLYQKTVTEIIEASLNVYRKFPGCISVSFFEMNPDTFEFYLNGFSGETDETSSKDLFQLLVDEAAVSDALADVRIVEYEGSSEIVKHCIIIPLSVQSGVIGIIILKLSGLFYDTRHLDIVSMHSNYFSILIHYERLENKIDKLEETSQQKLNQYTENIVASTRELKTILDSVHAGIIMVDKKSNSIMDANLAAAEMIGEPKESIVGSYRNKYFLQNPQKISSNVITTKEEGSLKKSNGELIPIIRTTANVILGNDEFILESFLNISERKKMEEALQEAHFNLERRVEERTQQLAETNTELSRQIEERIKAEEEKSKLYLAVQQSPTAIVITDLNGAIEYVNPRFTIVTGYQFEEVVGKNPSILKSNELTAADYKDFWATISGGKEWHGEFRNKKKDGELYWVSASVLPIKNSSGEITNYLAVEEDITEKKNFEAQLIVAKTRAEASDKLKSTLLENMSHEFRTPLIGILGFSQFLESEIQEQEHLEMLKDIYVSGTRLLSTLDGVLQLAQLESTISLKEFNRTNLADDLHKRVISYHIPAKEKGLKFNVNILSDNLFVQIDSNLFNKALNQLIDNAIKYTKEGSITVTAEENLNVSGEKCIVVKITDTGIGIDRKDYEVIFEAFRQASEGPSRNYEGTGLGLTIAKKIIELMRGKIEVESTPSNGSVFSIWMPAV